MYARVCAGDGGLHPAVLRASQDLVPTVVLRVRQGTALRDQGPTETSVDRSVLGMIGCALHNSEMASYGIATNKVEPRCRTMARHKEPRLPPSASVDVLGLPTLIQLLLQPFRERGREPPRA